MHKEWCGKPCSECKTSCALDESMPCSPNCELLGEDGQTLNYLECLAAGCDVIMLEEIAISAADAERWTRLMENPYSLDFAKEGIAPCSTLVSWSATFENDHSVSISIRAGRNFIYIERILWEPLNGTPIEEFVPDDLDDNVIGDHVFAPYDDRVSYVARVVIKSE